MRVRALGGVLGLVAPEAAGVAGLLAQKPSVTIELEGPVTSLRATRTGGADEEASISLIPPAIQKALADQGLGPPSLLDEGDIPTGILEAGLILPDALEESSSPFDE